MLACERRWAVAILRTYATTAESAPAISDAAYIAGYEALRSRARLLARVGLRLAVWLVWIAPFYGRFRVFTQLSLSERTACLERMSLHAALPVREAAFVLKCVACLALFRDADFRRDTGYDGVGGDHSVVRLRASGSARDA